MKGDKMDESLKNENDEILLELTENDIQKRIISLILQKKDNKTILDELIKFKDNEEV